MRKLILIILTFTLIVPQQGYALRPTIKDALRSIASAKSLHVREEIQKESVSGAHESQLDAVASLANLDIDTLLFEAWLQIAQIGNLSDLRKMDRFEFAKALGCREVEEKGTKLVESPVFIHPLSLEICYCPVLITQWERNKHEKLTLGKSVFFHELLEKRLDEIGFLAEFYTGGELEGFRDKVYSKIVEHNSLKVRRHELVFAILLNDNREIEMSLYALNVDFCNFLNASNSTEESSKLERRIKYYISETSQLIEAVNHQIAGLRKEAHEFWGKVEANKEEALQKNREMSRIFTTDDIPTVALHDMSPAERPADYFQVGDHLVMDVRYSQSTFSIGPLTKAAVTKVIPETRRIQVELVSPDGILDGAIGNTKVNDEKVWKWNSKIAPFVPEGKSLRKKVAIHKLPLSETIQETLTEVGIFTVEELENTPEHELAQWFNAGEIQAIKRALREWHKQQTTTPAHINIHIAIEEAA